MVIQCPYCAHEEQEPDDCYEEHSHFETECGNCQKIYGFKVEYFYRYDTYVVPCANGDDHDWRKIIGFPEKCFKDQYRCNYCDEERVFSQPPMNKEQKILVEKIEKELNKFIGLKNTDQNKQEILCILDKFSNEISPRFVPLIKDNEIIAFLEDGRGFLRSLQSERRR